MSDRENLERLKKDIVFEETLRGRKFVFHSTWGLFSPRGIDAGSRMLIDLMEIQPTDATLDLGCGYGALGIVAASLSPQGIVHMVDKDFVAIEYAKKNVQANKLDNCEVYLSNAFSHVPQMKFDNVLCNLPAKAGNEMFAIMMIETRRHLKARGCFYVVTIPGLKDYIKRMFKEIFGNYHKLKQGKTHVVAMAEKKK